VQESTELVFLSIGAWVCLQGEDRFAFEPAETTVELHQLLRGDDVFVFGRAFNLERHR